MKRLALLLPLLALAALARAADPATNAPVLPAWFADVRVGMSTNEFFARLPDAKWTCEDEGPTPWLVEWEDESAPDVEAGFIFVRGRLAFLLASGDQDASGRFAAWSSELESRFGPPDVRDAVPMLHDIGVRTAWTNGPAVSALLLHAGGMPGAETLPKLLSFSVWPPSGSPKPVKGRSCSNHTCTSGTCSTRDATKKPGASRAPPSRPFPARRPSRPTARSTTRS